MSTEFASALIAGIVAVTVALLTSRTQERKLRAELRTEFMVEEAIRALLEHKQWEQRSFDAISRQIPGFEANELRRLLIRAGALCFPDGSGGEWWGLRDRNQKSLGAAADEDTLPPAGR